MTPGLLAGPAGKKVLKAALNLWFVLFSYNHLKQILHLFAAEELGDFIAFLTAGRIVKSHLLHALYDIPLQREIEQGIKQYKVFLAYYHPPFEALLFWPLAYLSDWRAYVVWFVVNLGIFLAALYCLLRVLDGKLREHGWTLFLGILSFYPLALSLIQGQDAILLLLVISLAFVALQQGHDGRAGVFYALGLFKPHFLIPFIAALLLQRRWRALAGFSLTALVLGLLSLAMVGVRGSMDYFSILHTISQQEGFYGAFPHLMPNLRGLFVRWLGSSGWAQSLSWLASGLLFLTLWRIWRGGLATRAKTFNLKYAYTTVLALLLSYHLNGHDLLLLALAILLIFDYILSAGPTAGRHRMHLANLLVATVLLLVLMPLLFIISLNLSVVFLLLLALTIWVEIGCRQTESQNPANAERTSARLFSYRRGAEDAEKNARDPLRPPRRGGEIDFSDRTQATHEPPTL